MEAVTISALLCSLEKVTGALLSQLGGRSNTLQCGFSSELYSRTLGEAFVQPSVQEMFAHLFS